MASTNSEKSEKHADQAEPHGSDFVLDQNEMRRGALRRLTRRQGSWRLILPDTAMTEMSKSDKWQYTMQCSFEQIVPIKDRVFASISVGEALRYERDENKPITREALIDYRLSVFVRDVIQVVTSSHLYPSRIAALQEAMGRFRPDVGLVETNPERAKTEVLQFVKAIEHDAGHDVHKHLKNGRIAKHAQLGMLLVAIPYVLSHPFPSLNGLEISRLEIEKPFTYRFICLKMLNSMRWVQ